MNGLIKKHGYGLIVDGLDRQNPGIELMRTRDCLSDDGRWNLMPSIDRIILERRVNALKTQKRK